uniref:ribosomal protein L16 n=1 Tax=Prosopanche panguanensis TaxID=2952649 RepID=UPI0021146D6C|nr:ribosomal protein L16 [Prosopanche panguanensis]USN93708.1 ribosomal protein L16 [Prosopanche panguanensis]
MLPKQTKFYKQHRGRMKGISVKGKFICFGKFGIQTLEPTWITAKQLEAGRKVMTRYFKRSGKFWIRIFPDKPITKRSVGKRMGSGKGSTENWVAVIKPGRILYEVDNVSETLAKKTFKIVSSKLPVKTKFLINT